MVPILNKANVDRIKDYSKKVTMLKDMVRCFNNSVIDKCIFPVKFEALTDDLNDLVTHSTEIRKDAYDEAIVDYMDCIDRLETELRDNLQLITSEKELVERRDQYFNKAIADIDLTNIKSSPEFFYKTFINKLKSALDISDVECENLLNINTILLGTTFNIETSVSKINTALIFLYGEETNMEERKDKLKLVENLTKQKGVMVTDMLNANSSENPFAIDVEAGSLFKSTGLFESFISNNSLLTKELMTFVYKDVKYALGQIDNKAFEFYDKDGEINIIVKQYSNYILSLYENLFISKTLLDSIFSNEYIEKFKERQADVLQMLNSTIRECSDGTN